MDIGKVRFETRHLDALRDGRVHVRALREAEHLGYAPDTLDARVPASFLGNGFCDSFGVGHALTLEAHALGQDARILRINLRHKPPALELFGSDRRGTRTGKRVEHELTW